MSMVLDTGALIALERNDRAIWAALKVSASRTEDVVVPTTVLAQVWRGHPRQARLARVLQHCVLASFDDLARQVGELCAQTQTRDLCDAHVALVTIAHGARLYTSDPSDLNLLLSALGQSRAMIVRC
jgi:predicted nucleic acid-binding protein